MNPVVQIVVKVTCEMLAMLKSPVNVDGHPWAVVLPEVFEKSRIRSANGWKYLHILAKHLSRLKGGFRWGENTKSWLKSMHGS